MKVLNECRNKYYLAFAMLMTAFAVCPTYADIWSGAETAIGIIQTGLLKIAVPLAGVMALIALVIALTSNGQSFDRAIQWLKRILVVLAAILCLGWIIELIETATKGGGL